MTEMVVTDGVFSAEQKKQLAGLAEIMIPPADGMPGAGAKEIFTVICQRLRDHQEVVTAGLESLTGLDVEMAAREPAFREQPFLQLIQQVVVSSYYENAAVQVALGLEGRPPYPDGYELEPTDWRLLEPVRRREKLYRKV